MAAPVDERPIRHVVPMGDISNQPLAGAERPVNLSDHRLVRCTEVKNIQRQSGFEGSIGNGIASLVVSWSSARAPRRSPAIRSMVAEGSMPGSDQMLPGKAHLLNKSEIRRNGDPQLYCTATKPTPLGHAHETR